MAIAPKKSVSRNASRKANHIACATSGGSALTIHNFANPEYPPAPSQESLPPPRPERGQEMKTVNHLHQPKVRSYNYWLTCRNKWTSSGSTPPTSARSPRSSRKLPPMWLRKENWIENKEKVKNTKFLVSSQCNHVERARRVDPQGRMWWKLFRTNSLTNSSEKRIMIVRKDFK